MGDLARYRRDRDLHLSRGHLAASVIGVMLLVATSFTLGYGMGHREGPEVQTTRFTSEAPREDLVELLARVESSGDTTGGVGRLTFPDALTRNTGGALLDSEPAPAGSFRIEVGRYADVADARALREHLREGGVQAWVGAELESGVMSWRVAVGGFRSQDDLDEGMNTLGEALATWQGGPVTPRAISPDPEDD